MIDIAARALAIVALAAGCYQLGYSMATREWSVLYTTALDSQLDCVVALSDATKTINTCFESLGHCTEWSWRTP